MRKEKKKPPIDEEYLKQNDWWWRRLVFGHYQDDTEKPNLYQVTQLKMSHLTSNGFKRNDQVKRWLKNNQWKDWHDKLELLTYRYELARRVLRLKKKKFPHWPLLTEIEELGLIGVLDDRKDEICLKLGPSNMNPDRAKPDLLWTFDLTGNDKVLKDKFMLLINDERRRKGLHDHINKMSKSGARKSANAKNRHRGISWRGLELLDIQFFKIGTLNNDSESSTVSKLKREAKKWVKSVRKVFSDIAYLQSMGVEGKSKNLKIAPYLKENYRSLH